MGPAVRLSVFLISALVVVFAALYPYFTTTGSCGDPGCPHFSHAPVPVEILAGAVLTAAVVLPAATLAHRPRYRFASDRKPAEVYLAPEPDPPRP